MITWCSACGGIISSTEGVGGPICRCAAPTASASSTPIVNPAFTAMVLDARIKALELQLEEWRKVGAALRDDIKESLAVEGLEASDTPKSHYSTAFNRLLELLAEKKEGV